MFALVADVARYPEFVPWCKESRIISKQKEEIEASLVIAEAGFKKTFTTRNHFIYPHRIDLKLVDGPFKHLEGIWQFQAQKNGGCEVLLDLNFEFASSILSFAFGAVFTRAANSLVDAFILRARGVYGV